MSQTGHNPRGYNPVNYQHHYHWAQSHLLCQPDNIDQAKVQGNDLCYVNLTIAISVCFNETKLRSTL